MSLYSFIYYIMVFSKVLMFSVIALCFVVQTTIKYSVINYD